jgi:hypothetical protein
MGRIWPSIFYPPGGEVSDGLIAYDIDSENYVSAFISVGQLKLKLSSFLPIPVSDQILLIGPPYKALEKQVSNRSQ